MSVPDAKFTKGEFQVGMPSGILGVLCRLELTFCFPDRQTMAQNSLFLELLQMAIVDRCWILPYLASALGSS